MAKSTLETLFEEEVENALVVEEPTIDTEGMKKEVDDWKNKYMYALADIENIRKQANIRVANSSRVTSENIIRDLLPILDNLQRAEINGDMSNGVKHTFRQLVDILSSKGLTKIDTKDEMFNSDYHEAISVGKFEGVEKGHVIDCVQDGYTLNGNVLRHAKVVVSE